MVVKYAYQFEPFDPDKSLTLIHLPLILLIINMNDFNSLILKGEIFSSDYMRVTVNIPNFICYIANLLIRTPSY